MESVWKKTLAALEKDPGYSNLFHMMEQYGDATAAEMTCSDGTFASRTYNQYIQMSRNACAALENMRAAKEGEFIGLIYDTCMDWPVLFWGILMAGDMPLLLNPASEGANLDAILKEAHAEAYVAAKAYPGIEAEYIPAASLLHPCANADAPKAVHPCANADASKALQTGDNASDLQADQTDTNADTSKAAQTGDNASALQALQPGENASQLPCIEKWGRYVALCTSGTTGKSRIFLYDGPTIANHILSFDEAHRRNPNMPVADGESCRLLAFLPFHHVFGFSVVYLLYSCIGQTLVYLPDKSPKTIMSTCREHKVTHLYCVPMFFNLLAGGIMKQLAGAASAGTDDAAKQPAAAALPDPAKLPAFVKDMIKDRTLGRDICSMITGGGHIPAATLQLINAIGYPLANGFGMTETGIIAVEQSLDPVQRMKGSISYPFANTEWRIASEGGRTGEMFIRGNALYAASVIDGKIVLRDRDEWFGTGDIVTDKGDGLYVSGRVKDVIIGESGENIYPEELEDAYAAIPGVKNYCVLGIGNGLYEDIAIAIEPAEGTDTMALAAFVRAAADRQPAALRVRKMILSAQPLPISGNMKVKRGMLKRAVEGGKWACETVNLYELQEELTGQPGNMPQADAAFYAPAGTSAPAASDSGSVGFAASASAESASGSAGLAAGTFAASASGAAPSASASADSFTGTEEYRTILAEVCRIASEAFEVPIGPEDCGKHFIMNLGGNSLQAFSLFTSLEQRYGVDISDEEMKHLENCRAVAELVYARLHGLDTGKGGNGSGKALSEQELAQTERITDFAQSEEYKALKARMADTFKDGYNPYFIPHDSVIRDTSVIDGKELINLGSYNYLGMSGNPETMQAAKEAISKYGTSASGSRTLAGEKTLYQQLEASIADWKHTEASIVCTGGWATNLAFVSCFAKRGDFIVYDKLSHNSLTEGVKLSDADSKAFEHNNLKQLEEILKKIEGRYNKVLIIVEGVYSMDGDIAPIPEFVALKKRYKAFLMVDEAHSGCVIGDWGGGVDDYFHLAPKDIDIKYGTLSKGLGACGGYIAADASIVEYLRYQMNGFVFTAGIAPPLAAEVLKAIEIIRRDNTMVTKLHENIAYFIRRAKEEGMDTGLAGGSAIVPVMIGSDADAARISAKLIEEGVFVPPAMFPAVPMGESRLRFTISATHSIDQLEKAISATARILREEGIL